jgi:predicted transposase YdaD
LTRKFREKAERTRLISGFVDTYLRLNHREEQEFQEEIGRLEVAEQEGIMQIVTSWMQQGIEQGIEQGERSLILRQLTRQVGVLPGTVRSQVETLSVSELELLGEALLDFATISELDGWLRNRS